MPSYDFMPRGLNFWYIFDVHFTVICAEGKSHGEFCRSPVRLGGTWNENLFETVLSCRFFLGRISALYRNSSSLFLLFGTLQLFSCGIASHLLIVSVIYDRTNTYGLKSKHKHTTHRIPTATTTHARTLWAAHFVGDSKLYWTEVACDVLMRSCVPSMFLHGLDKHWDSAKWLAKVFDVCGNCVRELKSGIPTWNGSYRVEAPMCSFVACSGDASSVRMCSGMFWASAFVCTTVCAFSVTKVEHLSCYWFW